MERYVNPFTDFGFKKLFGEEDSKPLLMDFLNTLLEPEGEVIVYLDYLKNEHLGQAIENRKAIFDLYCTNQKGDKFIIELQKVKQKYFKDRSLYYSTFAVQEQAITGEWNFKINKVYTIALLDFAFDDTQPDKYLHYAGILDKETHLVFNDKLQFVYIEIPKFKKTEEELETHLEKWLFAIKHLSSFFDIPLVLQEEIFEDFFLKAEISKYNPQERQSYQDSMKYYRDLKNSLETAKEEGIQIGIAKGIEKGIEQGIEKGIELGALQEKLHIAKVLRSTGISLEVIKASTGLSDDELNQL